MSILDLFDKGGPVVWILAGYSVIAVGILIERCIYLMLNRKPSKDFEDSLQVKTSSIAFSEDLSNSKGSETVVVRSMLQASHDGVKDLERVASRVGSQELNRMERGLRTLAFLGNTAPLLGLFGTITGLIKAFMVIEQAGGKVDAQALAGGIWEAMITTGVGLAVSLPILLLLHLLEGVVDQRAHAIKRVASIVIEKQPDNKAVHLEDLEPHREEALDAI